MPYYKDAQNKVHYLEFEAYESLLPAGCVAMTLAEIEAHLNPPPVHAELVTQVLNEARFQRQPIIGVLDGLQASALSKGETASANDIEAAKQALRDITKVDLSACATHEQMRNVVKAAYAAIVAGASLAVLTAFRAVLT